MLCMCRISAALKGSVEAEKWRRNGDQNVGSTKTYSRYELDFQKILQKTMCCANISRLLGFFFFQNKPWVDAEEEFAEKAGA